MRGGGGAVVGLGGWGGQGGCERRIEVFVKIQKKNLGVGRRGGEGSGLGGQGGCDLRIKVFGKIHQKKIFFFLGGGGGSAWWGGVRVDVKEELKFL